MIKVMETFIATVGDIDSNQRLVLEQLVGQQLYAGQQVMIRVADVNLEATPQARNEALAKAAEIAQHARASVAAQAVQEDAIDAVIDEAIQHVRQQKRER
jgi:hypothetical protein